MDASLKQDAVVAEASIGTTPASPAFKLLRSISIGGGVSRPNERSPERVNHRQANSMFQGLVGIQKTIETPWVRDAAQDILWESVLFGAFSTDVAKNGSTPRPFTLEEKYEAGSGTDFYRRIAGCLVDSVNISFRNDGQPGRCTWNVLGRAETTSTSALGSATYAAASPGLDPVTASEIAADNLFGLSTPGIVGLNLAITNNLRARYQFGSPSPQSHGMGDFDVRGTVEFYLTALANYSTFATKQTAQVLELTIGSVTDHKDVLELFACDVWNPNIADGGRSTDHTVSLEFMAKYNVGDTASMQLTRQVPE